QQVQDFVHKGGPGCGAPLLVGASPAKPEALGGTAGAGVKEIALLGCRVLAGERWDAEPPAPLVPQQRIPRVAPRELAVLKGADEQVAGSGGSRPVGAQH